VRPPAGSAYDPYIDDLPLRTPPRGFKVDDHARPLRPPRPRSRPLKGIGSRLTGRVGCAILLVFGLICCGCGVGGSIARAIFGDKTVYVQTRSDEPKVEPQPSTVTVTVTTTPQIPESCRQSIRDMLSIIDAASRITSASSQQLDILSKAYQAILLGDTSRLNEAADLQRQLERELGHDQVTVQRPYEQIKDGIATCSV